MKNRTWLAGISALTIAVTAGVVAGSATTANANGPALPGRLVAAGEVQLQTGTTNRLVYVDGVSTTTDPTQAIGTGRDKCSLSPTTGSVGSWSATNGVPGFAFLAIGVAGTKQNGTACSQVESATSEKLQLALDGSGLNAFLGPLVATSARLDVEVKFDAVVKAELLQSATDASAPAALTYFMYTGANAVASPGANEFNCQLRSDSGPDSGANDNCTWNLTPAAGTTFKAIRLTAVKGQFDLKGGGDYATPSAHYTTFAMAAQSDGVLNCDTANIATTTGTGSVTGVTITRLDNGDGTACVALDYDLSTDSSSATFHKPIAGQPAAQFLTDITRRITSPTNPIGALRVDWEDTVPATSNPIPFCAAAFYNPGQTPTFKYSELQANSSLYDQSTVGGIQYACIYGQSDNLQDDGSVVAVDHVYFTGDIRFTP